MRIEPLGLAAIRFTSHIREEEEMLSGQREVEGLLCELLISTGINSHEICTQNAESLLWKAQEQNITADGTPLSVAQPGENERAEVIDDIRALRISSCPHRVLCDKQAGFPLQTQSWE